MATVAIQGFKGSYSEEAALRLFERDVVLHECDSFEMTFDSLDRGEVEYILVPVHNKIVGDIKAPKALIDRGGYKQIDELTIEVKHVLAGVKGSDINKITRVYSHIEALKQCRNFLNAFPGLLQHAASDTAQSIYSVVKSGASDAAAIGSERAAELYNAEILLENIADDRENWTTFNLLTK